MSQTLIIRGAKSLSDALSKLSGLPLNKPWVLTVDEMKSKRSVEQNSRLWAILTDIAEQLPDEDGKHYSPETWLSFFKAQILGKDTMIVDGNFHLVDKRSSNLKVSEFGDFMQQIEVFAVEHGVKLYQGVA